MDPKSTSTQRIESAPRGPLSPYIDCYVGKRREEDYATVSLDRQVAILEKFSRWLHQKRHEVADINETLVARFHRCAMKGRWWCKSDPSALARLLAMLRQMGVIPASAPGRLTPAQELARRYEQFLLRERALSWQTVAAWVPFIGKFLSEKFGAGRLNLPSLRAPDVTAFIQRHAYRHGRSHARKLVTAMRSFLRYLHYKGMVDVDLSVAVPKVANWSLSALPKHLSAAQVRELLRHCDRSTSLGRRNYAILLLLARLGLRAGEVIGLNLEDIDWENACITVRGKGTSGQLPLPADVARAIARYLRRDRPRCGCRCVFIRHRAPMAGLNGATAVAKIVWCALKKAGVVSARKGAHLLRHSLATEMLRTGASLDEIGEVLRHRSPDTTAIYAKVDVNALRALALPWPGGVR